MFNVMSMMSINMLIAFIVLNIINIRCSLRSVF